MVRWSDIQGHAMGMQWAALVDSLGRWGCWRFSILMPKRIATRKGRARDRRSEETLLIVL